MQWVNNWDYLILNGEVFQPCLTIMEPKDTKLLLNTFSVSMVILFIFFNFLLFHLNKIIFICFFVIYQQGFFWGVK